MDQTALRTGGRASKEGNIGMFRPGVFTRSTRSRLIGLALLGCLSGSPAAEEPVLGIAVLAHRGAEQAIQRWAPTAHYLSEKVPGYRFVVHPVDLEGMRTAVEQESIHFTLTNPGNYVELEADYGASRIASLLSREGNSVRVRYGAVIISAADSDILRLTDLRGHSFMAVSQQAFGGFQMAWREMAEQGIDPFADFSDLRFAGFPQDRIVLAVRDAQVDAATVRATTLARMIDAGIVDAADFHILNAQTIADSPLPVSTRLYPEWPFATLKHTPKEVATAVARALLAMPDQHQAAIAARSAGWTVPLDYSPVNELMQVLQIGPYAMLREVSVTAFLNRYRYWFIGAALLLIGLMLLNGYISRTNHRLKETERELRREIVQRERSQEALARYRDTLEEQVSTRTRDLRTTNQALENSRVALRELVRITSAPELSHEQRLRALLDAGRTYFEQPVAVLASVDDASPAVYCAAGLESGDTDESSRALNNQCASRLIQHHGDPLDIPDTRKLRPAPSSCIDNGWHTYLGAAVLIDTHVHATLEFAGREARSEPLSQWDREMLKVMAQWIGDELARQHALDSQQRHRAELARVSRMSTIGEMAASLAHELNQPLTGAINYSSGCLRMLRQGNADSARLIQGMERAVEGANLAADIIRQVREFVQKGDDRRVPVDLNHAIRDVVALAATELRRHDVELELDLDPALPDVEGNLIQLEQVILNLVRNAIDAMEQTPAAKRRLRIRTCKEQGWVSVRADDTGAGIPDDSLPRIFDAFFSTKQEGMGIGLSISRSIIEAHQGRISARTSDTQGAEFRFDLPTLEHA